MDVLRHFGLKHVLFRQEPHGQLYLHHAFEAALSEIVDAVLACESVTLVGAAGMGKSQLLAAAARELAARGVSAASFAGPALVAQADFTNLDAIFVDEADAAAPRVLDAVLAKAAQNRVTTVLAALESSRIGKPGRLVRLAPMAGSEIADFLVDASAAAGRPDLFTVAAQEAIVDAVSGNPRALKQIAGAALLEAMFDGGVVVEQRHVLAAIAARPPLPAAEPDYVLEAPQRPQRAAPRQPQPEPIVVATPEPETPQPMVPWAAEEPRRRFGARGFIAATGALGLLIAAALAYAVDTFGWDRISAFLHLPETARPASSELRPVPQGPAPGFSEPELAVLPDTGDIIDEPVALPALTETLSDGSTVVPPPVPDATTPGYRPPSATLPTISAAVRAGIANPSVGTTRSVAGSLPQEGPAIEGREALTEPHSPTVEATPLPAIKD
jgi:type II secretory pathway predicted ATPase ExeA